MEQQPHCEHCFHLKSHCCYLTVLHFLSSDMLHNEHLLEDCQFFWSSQPTVRSFDEVASEEVKSCKQPEIKAFWF